ncbi:STAS domain-containing protein [Microbacterium sp.]|uniref:STAS domain-containing protein n=1 Tax=Microbacterium sp. TaxID=51671 RepID=UPI003C729AE9
MPVRPAIFTTTELGSGAAALRIAGDMTSACELPLMTEHDRLTDAGATRLILDFGALDYMNSGGIGLLVTLLVRAQRRGQTVAAVGLTTHYRQIFQLTRLDEAIGLYDDLETALKV